MLRFLRPLLAIVGITAMFTLAYVEASDARVRGGIGSRGSRTFTPPPATRTAPNAAQPIQRSTTPAQPTAATRQVAPGAAARPGLFNRPGFAGGLVAGLLGAGLIGLLFGQGLFGNLAGFASVLGLLLQLALIGGAAFLLLRWWQRRAQPALAGVPQGAPHRFDAAPAMQGHGLGGLGGVPQPSSPLDIKAEDYDAFERLLGEIQVAFGKEDMAALRARATPEMVSYLAEDMAENASRGLAAELSSVKLLQGDLAEAWSEDGKDYATVAMRYAMIDTMVDRATRQVVEGDPSRPVEATELWTFVRSRSGPWQLSAIQTT